MRKLASEKHPAPRVTQLKKRQDRGTLKSKLGIQFLTTLRIASHRCSCVYIYPSPCFLGVEGATRRQFLPPSGRGSPEWGTCHSLMQSPGRHEVCPRREGKCQRGPPTCCGQEWLLWLDSTGDRRPEGPGTPRSSPVLLAPLPAGARSPLWPPIRTSVCPGGLPQGLPSTGGTERANPCGLPALSWRERCSPVRLTQPETALGCP